MAFAEWSTGQHVEFSEEVGEVDTANTVVQQFPGARVHKGRVIGLKGRRTKAWALEPLPPRVVKRAVDGSFRGVGISALAFPSGA